MVFTEDPALFPRNSFGSHREETQSRNVSVLFDKRRAFSAALWSRFLKRPITYSLYSALRVKATTRRRKRAHFGEKSRKIYYLSDVCTSETRRGTPSEHFPVWQQIVRCESILNFKKLSVRRTYTRERRHRQAPVSCSRDLHEPRNATGSTPYGLPLLLWSLLVIFLSCSVSTGPLRVESLYRSRSICQGDAYRAFTFR